MVKGVINDAWVLANITTADFAIAQIQGIFVDARDFFLKKWKKDKK